MIFSLILLVWTGVVRSQVCSQEDFAVTYEGVTAFSVASANRTCVCGNFVASPSDGGSIQCSTLLVSTAASIAGTATFTGTTSFNGNVAIAGGRSLDIATSGSSISTVNIGSGSSASNLNVFGTLTARTGVFNNNLNVAAGSFTTSSGIPAVFNGPVIVNAPVQFNGGMSFVGSKVQRDFYQWSTTTSYSNACVHLKTNIPVCGSYTMYRFLIEGYNYGYAQPIFSEVVGYAYAGSCQVINTQVVDRASGASTFQYKSSDNYVVVRVLLPATYYSGFSVSVWQVNPTWMGSPVQILSAPFPSCSNI